MRSVGQWVQTDDRQEIDCLNGVVGVCNVDSPAALRHGKLLRVFHRQYPAIGKVNVKRPERLRGIVASH